jgi:hypothetical protein
MNPDARGVERPPLLHEARGTATTWPQLAAGLADPDYRESLRLALEPERLAAVQYELHRESALSRLDFFERHMIARYEAGEPLREPQNILKWVAHVRSNLAQYLTADERAAFERVVDRSRALGVQIP